MWLVLLIMFGAGWSTGGSDTASEPMTTRPTTIDTVAITKCMTPTSHRCPPNPFDSRWADLNGLLVGPAGATASALDHARALTDKEYI